MNNLSAYEAVKDQMKTGDMILWSHNSLIGKLIEGFSHANVSHASLVIRLQEYEGLERRRFHMEATGKGVYPNLLSRALAHYDGEAWWYPLKDEWDSSRQAIGEKAFQWLGVDYDFEGTLRNAWEKVKADPTKLFCSEYVFLCYGLSGLAPTPGNLPGLGLFKEPVQILYEEGL
jgi:hypothetical protein